jgi:gag-polypeptide of LTR copia-type/Zinc knuckle
MSATPTIAAPEANAPSSSANSFSTTVAAQSTSLSDQLPSSVPKLDPSGLNWAIFSVQFRDAVEAKGFWGHFDGSEACPVPVNEQEPTNEETANINQWKKNERSAKSLLTQKLPDSALMRVHMKPTVKARWDAISTEYTEKGAFAQTEMRAKFLGMKCPEKGNVRDFLDALRVKKEELATMGVTIDDQDYRSTIISSLPFSLANFASSQLVSARLYAASKTIAPDPLIQLIAEESDRQRAQRAAWPRQPKKDKGEVKEEALVATPGTGKDKSKFRKQKGACWNCGEKGHLKSKCPKPKKESAPGSSAAANAAVLDSEDEAAFFMEPADETDSEEDSAEISERTDLNRSLEGESAWFSDASESAESGWDAEELSGVDWSETSSLVNVDLDSVTTEAEVAAQINQDDDINMKQMEIIDSGCTRHLTPD